MRSPRYISRVATGTVGLAEHGPAQIQGRITGAFGNTLGVAGLANQLTIGDRVQLHARAGKKMQAEIVSVDGDCARAMAFDSVDGIGVGGTARALWPISSNFLAITDGWLGRIVDPLGKPLDGRGPLAQGRDHRPSRSSPPNAGLRGRLGPPFDLGVRVLNVFTTCRVGQRLGLFAGSGVGKSSLLAMLARHARCDATVIAFVGERGREVREFLEDELAAEGLARAVAVVATSDSSPLMRREAAYSAMTIAEYYRDQGNSVLLLMDSITRFCLALREIGLSAGEPPATRGYPPSVFGELPRLLERAGPGLGRDQAGPGGFITGLFTVLVEGDDQNEPIADAVRGILDGHIVLDRQIAERGRYPAVDIPRSLSRSADSCLSVSEQALVRRARAILGTYQEVAELVRLGAYSKGADKKVDEAVVLGPRIENLMQQSRLDQTTLSESFSSLEVAIGASS